MGVLYTELTLTGESPAVSSLGEEAEWPLPPGDKRRAFRTVVRGSPHCGFSSLKVIRPSWPFSPREVSRISLYLYCFLELEKVETLVIFLYHYCAFFCLITNIFQTCLKNTVL